MNQSNQAAPAAPRTYPDAHDSDPVRLGWMVGAPPPRDKIISFTDGSFNTFPKSRWALSNYRQLVPTVAVARGGPVHDLPYALRDDLDAVTCTPLQPSAFAGPMTWEESLYANYTDGIVVLHKGRIVYERYFGVLTPDTAHIAYSVTKSFVGTLGAMLVADGRLDPAAPVSQYLPELAHSGFGDASIRDVLDMRLGIEFSEDYTEPTAGIWNFARAGGLLPQPPGYAGPGNFYAFLETVAKNGPHGQGFRYQTAITEVLAWILRRVTGQPLEALISHHFWQPLGMEHDALLTVDSLGTAFGGGGFNAVLRDQARFGEMMRNGGRAHGKQLVPPEVIADITRGGDREAFKVGGAPTIPGGSYRNMWWVMHNKHGAYSARGIHGQAIYIDPTAEMVIARFASHPLAGNFNFDPTSLPAYQAIAERLLQG